MNGIVLAAGAGRRLDALTQELPKTLLPVDGERTILEIALRNLRAAGIREVAVVTGFAAERIAERVQDLEERLDVQLELIFNPRGEEWNNAYSLWCARGVFADGALLVNGDTVHPALVEERVLARRGPGLVLAIDREKTLGAEEMKVRLDADGLVQAIDKRLDPATAHGEYIGMTLIDPSAASALEQSLEATWSSDPSLYYEDAFQHLIDHGGRVEAAPIGALEWVEVDDADDLVRAREIACRC